MCCDFLASVIAISGARCYTVTVLFCFSYCVQRIERGTYQESIQSNTITDPEHRMGKSPKCTKRNTTHKRAKRSAISQHAARNRQDNIQKTKVRHKYLKRIHKKEPPWNGQHKSLECFNFLIVPASPFIRSLVRMTDP